MAWKGIVEKAVLVPEGEYDATPIDIRLLDGEHGQMVKIDFMLTCEDELGSRQVSGVADKKIRETTKLGRWIAAIVQHMPEVGEEVTAGDLLHKPCRVVIKHKPNGDGKTYANVVDVLPLTVPSQDK